MSKLSCVSFCPAQMDGDKAAGARQLCMLGLTVVDYLWNEFKRVHDVLAPVFLHTSNYLHVS